MKKATVEEKTDYSKYRTEKEDSSSKSKPSTPGTTDTRERSKAEPVRVEKIAGRNDPCPCGSGKKYKSCHGR